MPNQQKLTLPNVLGLSTEGLPFGTVTFLQAVEDALRTVDNNVVYHDAVTVVPPQPTIRAKSAQGQAYSVSGVSLASGDDYAALVSDFNALLQDHLRLRAAFEVLVDQLRGA